MKTIKEANEFIEKQFAGSDTIDNMYWKGKNHYGKCELHQLLQYIYELEDNTREVMDKKYKLSTAIVTDIDITQHTNNKSIYSVHATLNNDPALVAFVEIINSMMFKTDFEMYKYKRIGKTFEEVRDM